MYKTQNVLKKKTILSRIVIIFFFLNKKLPNLFKTSTLKNNINNFSYVFTIL